MKIAYDINGNKVLKLSKSDLGAKGFSIQTLYNLPQTHKDGIGSYTNSEVREYVKKYGSKRQKELLKIDES